jgi:hypothetical protein
LYSPTTGGSGGKGKEGTAADGNALYDSSADGSSVV